VLAESAATLRWAIGGGARDVERGVGDGGGPASGWIGRHLASGAATNRSPLRAVGFGEQLPRSLYGPVPATALRSIAAFHLGGALPAVAPYQAALAAPYQDDAELAGTPEVVRTLEQLSISQAQPGYGARYPESDLGLALRQTATLIRAEVGLEVACVDVDGWDTHIAQGGGEGQMAALHADLSDQLERLSVVVRSEFGRRVRENGGSAPTTATAGRCCCSAAA